MALLVFGITLLAAVLLSCLAERTVLSVSVLFLATGIAAGPAVLGLVQLGPTDPVVLRFAELALFSILFTDGMRVSLNELSQAWKLPGRALFLGLPLTLAGSAVLAHYLVGFSWMEATLIGAALSPTDPVFAVAIVGRKEVPERLRQLLNVESGMNDGLALPIVLGILSLYTGTPRIWIVIVEVAMGVIAGVAIAWSAIRLARLRFFGASASYQPLCAFSVGLIILAVTRLTHANEFLGAFAGGITVATAAPRGRDAFHPFGELISELLKLAALLVFGALVSPEYIAEIGWRGWLFVVLVLVAVRPASLAVALAGSRLSRREWVVGAWFGPKGFATVLFSLLILQAGTFQAHRIFHLLAVVVAASIVAHSSTDVPLARWFRKKEPGEGAG